MGNNLLITYTGVSRPLETKLPLTREEFMFCISRHKTTCLWFLLVLSLLAPVPGICVDTDRSYEVYGYGVKSCGSFVQEKKNTNGVLYNAWVAGYLTAVNLTSPVLYSILGKTDINGAMLWLENYCNKNPLKNFVDAVQALVNELYPNRTTQAPK